MRRNIENALTLWKEQANRMPLLLRGARQVGKTYVVEKFGLEHFEQTVVINFELHPELISCFDSLEPMDILNRLFLLTQKNPATKNITFSG